MLERGGRVKVEAVGNVKAQTLLASTLKRVRRGSVVYTDRYQVYDALMFCGYRHLRVDHDRRFSRGKVHINGLEGFWAYAKQRLIKHHGVSKERFPLLPEGDGISATITATRISFPWWSNNSPNWCQNLYNSLDHFNSCSF